MSGHAFSRDGVNWTWSAAQPFHGKVCEKPHEPGSPFTSVCGSRERPFLVRSLRCHVHHRCQHTAAQEYLATCLLLRLRWLWSQVFDEQKRPTHLVSAINSVCQGGNKDATGKDCKTLSIDDDTNKFVGRGEL